MGYDLSVECSIEFGAVIDDPQFLVMIRHAVKYILDKNEIPLDYDIYKVEITWEDLRDWAVNSRHVRQGAINVDMDEYDVYDVNGDHDLLDYFFSADGPMMKALAELDQSQSEPRLTFKYSEGGNCWSREDPECREQLRIILNNLTTNELRKRGAHHADDDLPWGVRTTCIKTVKQGLRLAEELDVTLDPPKKMSEKEKRLATIKILQFAEAFHLRLVTDPGLMFVSCVSGG